jgi:hypothetical protein
MSFDAKHLDRLDQLTKELRAAPAITPDIIASVVANACARFAVFAKAGKTARFDALMSAGACNDAALCLIELKLPAWKLRRLVYEDGEWFCSLSREPNLPLAFDDTADGTHEVAPLAILSAFVEARRTSGVACETNSSLMPRIRGISDNAVCRDNFA